MNSYQLTSDLFTVVWPQRNTTLYVPRKVGILWFWNWPAQSWNSKNDCRSRNCPNRLLISKTVLCIKLECCSSLEFCIISFVLQYIQLQLLLFEGEIMSSFSSRQFWSALEFCPRNQVMNPRTWLLWLTLVFAASASPRNWLGTLEELPEPPSFNQSTLPASSTHFVHSFYLYLFWRGSSPVLSHTSREGNALIERLSCKEKRKEKWRQGESKATAMQHPSPLTSNIMLFSARSFDNTDKPSACLKVWCDFRDRFCKRYDARLEATMDRKTSITMEQCV